MVGDRLMRLRVQGLLALGLALGLVAGCSGSSAPAPAPPPVTTAPPVTTSAPSAEELAGQAAIEAYRGMWADFVKAGRTSDWQSPALGNHATGIALTNLSRGLYADSVNGLVTRGEPILSPVVSSVEPPDDPTRVIVTDCGDSTNSLKYRVADGSVVNKDSGGRRLIKAVVELQPDGSWKVSDFGVQALGSC